MTDILSPEQTLVKLGFKKGVVFSAHTDCECDLGSIAVIDPIIEYDLKEGEVKLNEFITDRMILMVNRVIEEGGQLEIIDGYGEGEKLRFTITSEDFLTLAQNDCFRKDLGSNDNAGKN